MNNINVTSLVGYLDRYDKGALHELQHRYPEAAHLLTPGKTLGDSNVADVDALRELCLFTFKAGKESVGHIRGILDQRIDRVRKVRLFGNLASAISAAGVVTAISLSHQIAALVSAGIVFSGSSAAFFADYIETSFGSSKAPAELRMRLAAVLSQLIELEGDLKLAAISGAPDDEWAGYFRKANAMTAELREIEFASNITGHATDARNAGGSRSS